MKKQFIFVIFTIILYLVGCTSKTIEADASIKTMLSELNSDEAITFDNCNFDWEYVVIDSAYHTKDALAELQISNRENISNIPYEDNVLVIVFVKENKIIKYTMINISENSASDILKNYLYQNTETAYPYGTIFSLSR